MVNTTGIGLGGMVEQRNKLRELRQTDAQFGLDQQKFQFDKAKNIKETAAKAYEEAKISIADYVSNARNIMERVQQQGGDTSQFEQGIADQLERFKSVTNTMKNASMLVGEDPSYIDKEAALFTTKIMNAATNLQTAQQEGDAALTKAETILGGQATQAQKEKVADVYIDPDDDETGAKLVWNGGKTKEERLSTNIAYAVHNADQMEDWQYTQLGNDILDAQEETKIVRGDGSVEYRPGRELVGEGLGEIFDKIGIEARNVRSGGKQGESKEKSGGMAGADLAIEMAEYVANELLPNGWDGKVDRVKLFTANFGKEGFPFSEGRTIRGSQAFYIDEALRIKTGAQAPVAEAETIYNLFAPKQADNDKQIKMKLRATLTFFKAARAYMQDTAGEEWTPRVSADLQAIARHSLVEAGKGLEEENTEVRSSLEEKLKKK